MALTDEEKKQLRDRVAAFEAATGIELVTAVQPRSDDYPEIPWKAFALGVAAGSVLLLLAILFPDLAIWHTLSGTAMGWGLPSAEMTLAVVLCTGIVSTMLTFWIPPYARLFLSAARVEGETRQAAQALFLEHELFRTHSRTGVLMLVCTFEHRVVLLADRGLQARLPAGSAEGVIAAMTAALQAGAWAEAFATGIRKLESAVLAAGLAGGARDIALPDHLDTHRGEGDSC